MPVSSTDLLDFSEHLLNQTPSSECLLRASIGRAYYAVYHEALSVAESLQLPQHRTNTGQHDQLISRFDKSGKKLRIIANRIAAAKMARVEADYKLHHMVSSIDARKHLVSCQSIVNELARLQASNTGT
ncbi:MAG: hypothetical protein GTN92_09465 [Pseudomonas stutzeri]|nr:hypothetical protein [Stutzerimonas stutzeri]